MIRRLRVKFICINMAIVTVMMLAILGMLLHFTRNDLEQQSIRVMQSVMEDRAYPSRPGKFPRQAQLPYFYVSVNTLGELSASFGGYYDLTDTEAIQQIITLALNSDDQTGILKDYSLRFQKRTTPFGQTIVFVDMSSELTTMRSLTNTCVIIGVLSFAVFLGLSFLLARWAVKPVETAWNQQRQFVADASHELKTPLTVILTNAELLQEPEQVADILLDNASKYASADSTVRVILRRQGSHCLLSVASAGDAISKEDLKNIFKRFYRMDKARSMNHSYGLGLSIADSIVSKHGGKIWAESADGVNTFFVQLPTA